MEAGINDCPEVRSTHRKVGQHNMVTHTSSLGTMLLVLLTYQLATVLLTQAQNPCSGQPTEREPANSDIQVYCGSDTIELEILLCPIYFIGYNESTLALNAQYSNDQCKGTADWTVDPPVVRFRFAITEQAITTCSSKLTVTEEVGTGAFSDFSIVQFVNISGTVSTHDVSTGIITYQQDVMYKFSCRYPLQYLVNNTEISVTGVNLAIRDNNGSFISALSMRLYSDRLYSSVLQIPPVGLDLKTRIYVEVKASNLTSRFRVLLDRCYATPSPFPLNLTCHDLFVGCNRDCQTIIAVNGLKQEARFSFETFRFQNQDTPISTYYIHCNTRLCVNNICPDLIQNCTNGTALRRRRSVDDKQTTTVSDTATVISGPITTRLDNGNLAISGGAQQASINSTTLAVSLLAGIISIFCLALLAFIVYHMSKSSNSNKTMLYPKE